MCEALNLYTYRMKYLIVGLGNPGTAYEHTRHNVGRMVVEEVYRRIEASDWRDDKTLRARVCQGVTLGGAQVELILPDNYMNRSGGSVSPRIKTPAQLERLIVVHDDIDLPQGTIKIVHDRGAGGHNGVRSIERALKSRAFTRVRVGVLPLTPEGKPRKPKGAEAVNDFILKGMTKRELEAMHEEVVRSADAVLAIVHTGRDAAMRAYNGG